MINPQREGIPDIRVNIRAVRRALSLSGQVNHARGVSLRVWSGIRDPVWERVSWELYGEVTGAVHQFIKTKCPARPTTPHSRL